MIDESWQETLINWRCLGKFCFLFWALFARLPPRPPQFSFFLAQNLNVIPISCSKTVCLFHKTDMGGRDYYIILWQAFNNTFTWKYFDYSVNIGFFDQKDRNKGQVDWQISNKSSNLKRHLQNKLFSHHLFYIVDISTSQIEYLYTFLCRDFFSLKHLSWPSSILMNGNYPFPK